MPAVAAAQAQAQLVQVVAGIGAQVVAVDRGPGVAAAHAQGAVAVACGQAGAGLLVKVMVHAQQHAAQGTGIGLAALHALDASPAAQALEPELGRAWLARSRSRRVGIQCRTLHTLAQGIAQDRALAEQHRVQRRVDLPGQLPQAVPGLVRRGREQQAFIHGIARSQALHGAAAGALVGRGTDAGERRAAARHVQLHVVGRIIEYGPQKQVAGLDLGETPVDPTRCLQDVELAPHQAGYRATGQQVRLRLGHQAEIGATDTGLTAHDEPVAGRGRKLHLIGRARLQVQVAGDIQGTDGVTRGHHAPGAGSQSTDPAVAAQGSACVDRHRRLQVAVDRQQSTIDPGRAAVAAVTREHQPAGPGLDQTALVDPLRGSRVPGHAQGIVAAILLAGSRCQAILPAAILEGLLPGLAFRGVLGLTLHQGLVGDAVAPDIALPAPQVDVVLTQ
ncbi:hypothetical protein D3C79_650430 [compost metagenome]